MSSHAPWNRIPQLIDWNKVGNGSIFNRIPVAPRSRTDVVLERPRTRPAAYGQSIQYSLNTLISFVQHYGDQNLVLIVLGDHQPWAIVSGLQRRVTTCRSRSSPTTRRC